MKRTDGLFQGKFMGQGANLGDNLSPGMRAGSTVAFHLGGGGDDAKGE